MDTATTTVATHSGAGGGARLLVPDVLRGVALLAMLIAHANPLVPQEPGWLRFVIGNINDLASPLFALVMGMSAQLIAQRTPPGSRTLMLLQQFARGAVLIALGVWLETWESWVAIVLSHLGVLLIVGAPLLLLSSRWVATVAAAVVLVSEPARTWALANLTWVYTEPSRLIASPADWIVLSSHYRLLNLLPFFLLGALLLRHGFVRDRMLRLMLAIAVPAYLVRPVLEISTGVEFGSGTYADTLHDIGLVFAAYVVVVYLATVEAERPRRVLRFVFEPLRAIGSVALSLYLLHVAVLAWGWGSSRPPGNDYVAWLLVVPGMVVVGWLWWRFIGPGPVEWLLGWVIGRPKHRRRAAG